MVELAIIQTARPRGVIALLKIGLAIQMHHLYRSRFIFDILNQMWFSSSYGKVLRFEKNVTDTVAVDILGDGLDSEDKSVLFAGDNVDRNILTIDGKCTFHGTGMIASLMPGWKANNLVILRQAVSELKYLEKTKIDALEYRLTKHDCRYLVFKNSRNPSRETELLTFHGKTIIQLQAINTKLVRHDAL